jgi:NAD(P)-dependent dehydrogenase (short-subunit alcohol dehydrogenase family)
MAPHGAWIVFYTFAGLLISGIIPHAGLLQPLANHVPFLVGHSPLFTGEQRTWTYSYDRLATVHLGGQTALVTGANSGIGYAVALHLARRGAHVMLGCRSALRCEAAAAAITRNLTAVPGGGGVDCRLGSVRTLSIDTSSLASVRAAAHTLITTITTSLDMLVLNAGILASEAPTTSVDNIGDAQIETVFATNHIGHHLLLALLEPLLRAAADARGTARVVLVSSHAHCQAPPFGVALSRDALLATRSTHGTLPLYGQSKLAQILEAQEAAKRLGSGSGVLVNACHPGAVSTGIFAQLPLLVGTGAMGRAIVWVFERILRRLFWTAEEGALTPLYLAASDEVCAKRPTGRYFVPQAVELEPCKPHAANGTLQSAVWALSDELAGLPVAAE